MIREDRDGAALWIVKALMFKSELTKRNSKSLPIELCGE